MAGHPELVILAAVARNGVIGKDGALPWRLPEDLRHFRELTMGHPVLMGRKTWDSLPSRVRPLPGRRNVVLTRQAGWQAEGAEVVSSLDDALARLAGEGRVFVIGGAELYAAAMPLADALALTEIDREFDGDVYFPPLPPGRFERMSREPQVSADPAAPPFAFASYRRC